MADPTLPVENDVGALVLQAPENVWRKIKKALNVQTREQAASLVQADDKARQLLLSLLSGTDTVVTKPGRREQSFVSTTSKARPPLSEQMYGSRKAGMKF